MSDRTSQPGTPLPNHGDFEIDEHGDVVPRYVIAEWPEVSPIFPQIPTTDQSSVQSDMFLRNRMTRR